MLGIGGIGRFTGLGDAAKCGNGGNGGERLEPCLRGRGRAALLGPLRKPVQDAVGEPPEPGDHRDHQREQGEGGADADSGEDCRLFYNLGVYGPLLGLGYGGDDDDFTPARLPPATVASAPGGLQRKLKRRMSSRSLSLSSPSRTRTWESRGTLSNDCVSPLVGQ